MGNRGWVAVAATVFIASCGSGAPSTSATSTTSETSATSAATDAAASYASALAKLQGTSAVTYVIDAEMSASTGGGSIEITTRRDVRVDAANGLADVRAAIHAEGTGKEPVDVVMLMVYERGVGYVTVPSWTGERKGKWMKFTEASAASVGVQADLSVPEAAPTGLETFTADRLENGGATIVGSMAAPEAVVLLGIGSVLKDPELAESLSGRVPATVTIDPVSRRIREVELTGVGHSVSASSSAVPQGLVQQMVAASSSTITFSTVDEALDIDVPAAADIYSG